MLTSTMEGSLEQYASFAKETATEAKMKLLEKVQAEDFTKNITNSLHQIQRQLFARSERVKGIDFHPVEPWILTTLYSGRLLGAWLLEVLLVLILYRSCLYMVI